MSSLPIADHVTVSFFPLQMQQEGEEWLVGREEISSYVTLPKAGVEIIELLQEQKTIAEVRAEILSRYGEEPEIGSFLEALIDCGFVERVGGMQFAVGRAEREVFLPALRAEHVAWLFSRPMLMLYGLAAMWAVLWILRPGNLPKYEDWFYHPSLAVVASSLFVLSWLHLAWHELWHFLAARALGIRADFSLGTRLSFIVAQTDVSGVWSLPRKKRTIVYLAGMIGSLLLMVVYLALLTLSDANFIMLPPLMYRLLKALIFGQFWGLLWEFQFQMRTDIYYLVANFLNCKNLMEDSRTLLRSLLARAFGRWRLPRSWKADWAAADLSAIPNHEMRAVRMYLPFYLLGTLFILGNFFFRSLPITWEYLRRSISALADGWSVRPDAFLDALVFLTLTAFTYGLLAYLKWRERGQAQSALSYSEK